MTTEEIPTSKYASVKLSDEHVVNMTDGSVVEFVAETGETIIVHAAMHKDCEPDPQKGRTKGHPQVISRSVLVGDGKTARECLFQDWIILPASWVEVNGKILCNKEKLEANGVAYFEPTNRMVVLYPAVHWRDGVMTKDSEVGYRPNDRSADTGFKVSEIRVKVPTSA